MHLAKAAIICHLRRHMLFFTPKHIKLGNHFVKEARKILAYKSDLLSKELRHDVETAISALQDALQTKEKEVIETRMKELDTVCGKMMGPPKPDAAIRENVEVVLVAIVVALGVRTYFIQPFSIPTGSMQPTLNGIRVYPTQTAPPNPAVRFAQSIWYGRTWFDVVADDDETVTAVNDKWGIKLKKGLGTFGYTEIVTTKNTYIVNVAIRTATDHFGIRPERVFKKGDSIMRGYEDSGDSLFVDKFSYHWVRPSRGEVFVFHTQGIATNDNIGKPFNHPSQYYIKRLCGLPGDTLEIDPPVLRINGERAKGDSFDRVMSGTRFTPNKEYMGYANGTFGFKQPILRSPGQTYTLPPKSYMAMGDNSYHSSDSRDWGPVPERNLMGRAMVVYWPFGHHFGRIK